MCNVIEAFIPLMINEPPSSLMEWSVMGKTSEEFSEKEAAARRDAVIKRMIAMPPKPHSEMKVGKKKNQRGKSGTKKKPAVPRLIEK